MQDREHQQLTVACSLHCFHSPMLIWWACVWWQVDAAVPPLCSAASCLLASQQALYSKGACLELVSEVKVVSAQEVQAVRHAVHPSVLLGQVQPWQAVVDADHMPAPPRKVHGVASDPAEGIHHHLPSHPLCIRTALSVNPLRWPLSYATTISVYRAMVRL